MKPSNWQYFLGLIIGSNFYIAFISAAIAFTGFILFKTTNLLFNTLFVFFVTQTAYNLQRYFKWRKNIVQAFLLPYIPSKIMHWVILIGISGLGVIWLFFYLTLPQIELLAAISVITSLYLFVNPVSKKLTGLRYIPYLKTIIVAFCWTILFFILTFNSNYIHYFENTWIYWLLVFLEIWQACILFDLRDIEYDKNEVKTFANMFSLKWVLGIWFLLTCLILGLLINEFNYLKVLSMYVVIAFLQLYCILKKPEPLNFTFLMDGSLIIFTLLNYVVFKY